MVGKTRSSKRLVRSLVIGGAIGALALTPGLGRSEDEKPGAARVEREAPESAADAAVRTQLQVPAANDVGRSVSLGVLVSAYERALGVRMTVTDAAHEAAGERDVPMPTAAGLTAEQHLDFALWQLDLHLAVRDGGVAIGTPSEVLGAVDRRIYDIRPVQEALAAHWNGSGDEGSERRGHIPVLGAEDMITLIQMAVGPQDVWMGESVSISSVDGGLAVVQTTEVHAGIEAFLARLATYFDPVVEEATPADQRLQAALARRVSVRAEGTPLRDVALRLEEAMGAPVMAAADCADAPITLDLVDIPAQQAATWLARSARVYLSTQDGVLLFSQQPRNETRLYGVGAAIAPPPGRVLLDHVVELVTFLEPRTWEEFGSVEAFAPDTLLVRNTQFVHAKITRLIGALERFAEPSSATSAVSVVVEVPETAADTAVHARLDEAAATGFVGDFTLATLPRVIRDTYGISVLIGKPGSTQEHATVSVPDAEGLTVRQQLSRALAPAGLGIGVQDGVLRIGKSHAPVGAIERRYYDLRPVVQAFAARARDASSGGSTASEPVSRRASVSEEDIVALVYKCVGPKDIWTSAGVSLAFGRELLVAVQTRDVHERTHHMLERLLDYQDSDAGVLADPEGSVWFYDVATSGMCWRRPAKLSRERICSTAYARSSPARGRTRGGSRSSRRISWS